MEHKKIKKLVLNQEVISNLSNDKMNNLKGGTYNGTPWFSLTNLLGGNFICDPPEEEDDDDTNMSFCLDYGSAIITCCNYQADPVDTMNSHYICPIGSF